tara:strand:+ start:1518 stop:2231 length:714 start_codon:yes stop_codon:yes gene_type:complete
MQLIECADYEEMSFMSANSIVEDLRAMPDQWWVVATGNSPKKLYKYLTDTCQVHPDYFRELGIIKLDEWGGIPMDAPNSCESFIQKYILGPLSIPADRYLTFNSQTKNPEQECLRVCQELRLRQPVQCGILGLGANGHIGFNEPAEALVPHCHVALLSKESQQHQMVRTLKDKPSYGMTFGMADILGCRKIILLITGEGKKEAISQLLSGRITTAIPASFLWLHPRVECYIDSSSYT